MLSGSCSRKFIWIANLWPHNCNAGLRVASGSRILRAFRGLSVAGFASQKDFGTSESFRHIVEP
jgi:hypothetical protein